MCPPNVWKLNMKKPVTVAMVGATGAVGETLLEILGEREFPMKDFIPPS